MLSHGLILSVSSKEDTKLKPGDLVKIKYFDWNHPQVVGKVGLLIDEVPGFDGRWQVLVGEHIFFLWEDQIFFAYVS